MGSSSSIALPRDNNIEVNIVDEAQPNGRASIQRHSSQPASTIFSTFKPRQKHQDGTFRATTLRSSGSFDPSTPPSVGSAETVGQVKKEFDTLKLTKEQEIQALQRKEQKLDMENNRLRAELHALNKQCQKLRAERDTAMESSYLATERATALEQDREKIQRQFKIFRETKEAEIQTLLQAKRQLESEFHRMQAHGMATIDDHNSTVHDIHSSGQSTRSVHMGDQSHWWAVPESETTSLFGSHAHLQNGSQVGYSESVPDVQDVGKMDQRQDFNLALPAFSSNNDALLATSTSLSNLLVANASEICDSTILRCYISATPDTLNEAQQLLHHPDLKRLKLACEKEGTFLSIIHFTDIQDYCDSVGDAVHQNTLSQALSKSSVFVSFLGSCVGKYTESEFEEALFKPSVSKSTLFCIKNSGGAVRRANENLVRKIVEKANKLCMKYNSPEESCKAALKEISKAVRLEFGVRLKSNHSLNLDPNEVLCLDEMMLEPLMERAQLEISSLTNTPNCIQPAGVEKCYDRLDEVITSPGPVPPLLVSGCRSSGKTLLLSSWAAKLKSSHSDVVILQHFVTNQNSIDSKPVIVFRRLLSQLCQHLPPGSHLPLHSCTTYDAGRLKEILPRWIDQLSSRRNKRILLAIDSIDRLKDVQRYFSWLLDPLPVAVRVVISVDVDSCPEEWRQFPTLHLEPLSIHGVKQLLKEHAQTRNLNISQSWERDVVSQCRTATTCHPLYVTLLSALVCSVCEGLTTVNLFHLCAKKQDSREVYNVLLRDVESRCRNKEAKQRFKSVLQALICSRSGLSETEVMSLFPDLTWCEWMDLHSQLTQYCVLKEQAGVLLPHNSEIAALLYDKYVGNDVHERRCRQKMITWTMKIHEEQVTPRNTDLLLWMLQKDEERSTLLDVLKSPLVFQILYTSGQNSELVEFWNYLNEDKQAIAKYYSSELRKMEAATSGQVFLMTEVAQIYQSFGRFLNDMGLMEEAVSSLQKSLEIQETVLDPDHPAVADSLHYLASVYSQWGKFATAESLFRQALELIESAVGHDHLRVAQELGALARIARKMDRQETADNLHRREMAIASRSSIIASSRIEHLRKRALRLEELTLGEDSVEVANALNDLGVLYHLQNNLDNAESFFLRSLKIREKLVGLYHIDAAQSFHNLASIYNQKKNYSKAVECMNKALTIRRKHFHNDASVVTSLKHMAVLYKKLKQFDHACEVYDELLSLSIEASGTDSVPTANAMVNLAVAECHNTRLDVALPLYKKALKIYQDVFGQESPQVLQTLKNIAILLFQKGEFNEAALLYKESMGSKFNQANLAKPMVDILQF